MKRIFYLALLTIVLSISTAYADDLPASLFFTPDEVKQIQTLSAQTSTAKAGGDDIHLGAIMYYAPNNWTIWLQGMRWTPTTKHADLNVIEVMPDHVLLHSMRAGSDVTLKPYQTFQMSTGHTVEGLR